MSQENQNGNQLNIELSEDVAEGIYSNLAIISHNQSEFVVDFIRMVPNVPKAKVKSRVILTPQHAKRLLHAMAENVKKYESQFGVIEHQQDQPYPPINFTPTAMA
ncbi:MAG: DUF3467 domain-containing protein [Saprospiraceae bacterium]|nr:DUF3467 domain-containing protein [Saprospiraceae bacterium]